MDIQGKKIVVTGGEGALGQAVTALLRERGAEVHAPGRAVLDVVDEAAVAAFYAEVAPLWASVHVAGGFAMAPLTETTLAQWRQQVDINAVSCFLACREAVRAMRRSGGGRIVNVAARAALDAPGGMTGYVASKAAVVAMTRAVAAETAADYILVNAVAPSIMDTPQNRAAMPSADFGRWPKTREVAEIIAFLVSPRNTLTSGAVVPVYGRA